MSRIQFRQKTEEEIQADAAARARRDAPAVPLEARPSAAAPPPADEEAAFTLDGGPAAVKPKKGRRKAAGE